MTPVGPQSLSTRLALLVAGGVALAVAVFAVAAYLLVRDGAFDNIDRSLAVTAGTAATEAAAGDLGTPDFEAPPSAGAAPVPRRSTPSGPIATFIQIVEGGEPLGQSRIAGTSSFADPLPALPAGPPRTVAIRGENFRVVVRELAPAPDGVERAVIVARPTADIDATLDESATRLAAGAAAAAVLALGIGLLVSRRALRRLVRVQAAAEKVAESEDLSVRIDEGRPDEVGRLARSMNRMLGRLEEAQAGLTDTLAEQRRFAADASHELRTPLTALSGNIDLLARPGMLPDERDEVLQEMRTAADRMGRMVEDLLALARAEAEEAPAHDRVDLLALLEDILGPEEPVEVSPPGPPGVCVVGETASLHALFENLVANARRHGTSVRVEVEASGEGVVVRVIDNGPGVPAQHADRIFDRFYRAPELRNTPGSGLGLAIARKAAERCGGTLSLVDRGEGACFEARLGGGVAAPSVSEGVIG